jgi:hypothetical protein
MSVVGTCDGIPVDGTSEGRNVIGAVLLGSSLGADVVGADDGSIVDGRALGREVGYEVGPGEVGSADGGIEGSLVGSKVGTSEGIFVGETVWDEGATEGSKEGGLVGLAEGANVGSWEGRNDGDGVDTRVGPSVGTSVGNAVLRCVGRAEGRTVGTAVRPAASGRLDGANVELPDLTLTETTETRSAVGLGSLVSPVEGSAGTIFTTGPPVTAPATADLVQLKVSRPAAMSATMLSARAAADSPSSDDRMRTSMETLAARRLRMWNRSTGTR